ncbi:MAG: hypothetical protein AABW68_04750 [archaeon]
MAWQKVLIAIIVVGVVAILYYASTSPNNQGPTLYTCKEVSGIGIGDNTIIFLDGHCVFTTEPQNPELFSFPDNGNENEKVERIIVNSNCPLTNFTNNSEIIVNPKTIYQRGDNLVYSCSAFSYNI